MITFCVLTYSIVAIIAIVFLFGFFQQSRKRWFITSAIGAALLGSLWPVLLLVCIGSAAWGFGAAAGEHIAEKSERK